MQNPLRNRKLELFTILGFFLILLGTGFTTSFAEENSQGSLYTNSSEGHVRTYEEYLLQYPEEDENILAQADDEAVDEALVLEDAEEEDDWGFLGDAEDDVAIDECYNCAGYINLCYGDFIVSGDRGRFREDQWMNNNGRGGIDWFHYECFPEGDCDYHYLLEGKAIVDDWYDAHFLAKRADGHHYFKSDYTNWRHYYDGTSKFANSREIDDRNIYLDRKIYSAEFGYTPGCSPDVIVGWHRLQNDGKGPTLRSLNTGGTYYNYPSLLHEDGTTDTFYAEIAKTYCCKYNVRMRTEYEKYDDNQSGKFGSEERFKEDDDFRIWRQYVLFDTFLNNCSYLSFGYYFYDLKNTSERDAFEHDGTPIYFERDNKNEKYAHIGFGRYNNNRFWDICHLTFDTRLRAEYNDTTQRSTEDNKNSGGHYPHVGLYKINGSYDQWRFEESALLTYKGIYRTTLSADASLEQRYEDRKAKFTKNGTARVDRKADVDVFKQQYTLTGVHRFNNCLKTTFRARYKRLVRDFDEDKSITEYYPGYMGDFIRNGGEIVSKTEWIINPCLNTYLYYQWREESFKTDLGERTNRRTVHRIANTTSWTPCDRLFLTGTGIYENRRSDTPTDPCATYVSRGNTNTSKWKQRSQSYDFKGDNFAVELDGSYAFNPDSIFKLGYKHRQALGSRDFAAKYSYDQIDFGLERKVCGMGDFSFSYTFINFHDKRNDHNDYEANGINICWKHVF